MPVSTASIVRFEVLTGVLFYLHVLQRVSYLIVGMASYLRKI
jgi:uncharacterized membrane protein YuzA (DUF378 family)